MSLFLSTLSVADQFRVAL